MPSFKNICLLSAAALAPLASALDETEFPFKAPTSTDSRSPCPGLNALANHGLLPSDGKNIDLATLVVGAYKGFGLAEAATRLVGTVGLQASTTGDANTFNLEDLNAHEVIEHDGSMSREDINSGNSLAFSDAAWKRTLASWGDVDTITFEVAGAERKARFEYGAANNPDFNATFANSGSLLEYSLILSAFGDVTKGNANAAQIKYLIEKERLPIELGWQPPTTNITVASAQAMSASIASFAK